MDWTSIITTLSGLVLGGGSSILYFRPKLKEAKVGAAKAQTQYLEERINSTCKLYEEQGKVLDEIRSKMLELSNENLRKDLRISQLEAENRILTEKVSALETELNSYKIRSNGNNK